MPANPKAKYVITADDQTAAAWKSATKTADAAGKQISSMMKGALAGVSVGALAGIDRRKGTARSTEGHRRTASGIETPGA